MFQPVAQITDNLRKYWWLFLIRGLFGLALGVLALVFPGATLAVAVLLIGAYLIVDGVVAIIKSFSLRPDKHWWALLFEGILGVIVGLAIFMWPGISLITLAYLVGWWALFTGILAVGAAVRLRAQIQGEWLYILFGIVSVIFGFFVLMAPATGLVYLVLMISIYGFVIGFTMIALAFRAKSLPA